VDRELVVVSQAAASVSPGGTQDDPMYGLLLNFAKGETHSVFDLDISRDPERDTEDTERLDRSARKDVSEAARRVSLAAVAAGAAAREAEEVRDLRLEYDDDDDDATPLPRGKGVGRETSLAMVSTALSEEESMDELDPFVAATQREWDDLQDVLGTAEGDDFSKSDAIFQKAKGTPRNDANASPSPRRERTADRVTLPKICAVCGEDCSRERRVFSRAKGYAHKRCAAFERDVSSAKAKALSAARKRRFSASVAGANLFEAPSPREREPWPPSFAPRSSPSLDAR
jgi:hypothetical protein